jgi:hypothetical protein
MNQVPGLPICILCDEPILAGEVVDPDGIYSEGGHRLVHFECKLRAILGGLNHMKGTCSCCGGTDDPDPPGMTRREAAKAAYAYWQQLPAMARAKAVIRPLIHQAPEPEYDISEDGRSITCRECGSTSHHPQDVANLYCAKCKRWHEKAP